MTESGVFLREAAGGKLVEATFVDEITPEHLALWERHWLPTMRRSRLRHSILDTMEDAHWDWRRKSRAWRGMLGYHSFALLCQGDLQGLMITNDISSARLQEQFGKPLIYVEFVATAPWNRPQMGASPRYRGIGFIFMLAAIETSRDAGFKGRVGLHSLPAAEPFYEARCGFTRLGPDASHQNLTYFEMTEKQANAFRRSQN